MTATTRYNSVGLAGRKGVGGSGKSDPRFKQYVVPITVVASAAPQPTGIILGKGNALMAQLNTISPETGAAIKTVDVGTVTSPTLFFTAGDVSANNIQGATFGVSLNLEGQEVAYTLAGADFTDLVAELILTVIEVAE